MNARELFLYFMENLEFIFGYLWSIIIHINSTLFGAWDTAMLHKKVVAEVRISADLIRGDDVSGKTYSTAAFEFCF